MGYQVDGIESPDYAALSAVGDAVIYATTAARAHAEGDPLEVVRLAILHATQNEMPGHDTRRLISDALVRAEERVATQQKQVSELHAEIGTVSLREQLAEALDILAQIRHLAVNAEYRSGKRRMKLNMSAWKVLAILGGMQATPSSTGGGDDPCSATPPRCCIPHDQHVTPHKGCFLR
jgi:hypothetical protein